MFIYCQDYFLLVKLTSFSCFFSPQYVTLRNGKFGKGQHLRIVCFGLIELAQHHLFESLSQVWESRDSVAWPHFALRTIGYCQPQYVLIGLASQEQVSHSNSAISCMPDFSNSLGEPNCWDPDPCACISSIRLPWLSSLTLFTV